MEPWVMMFREGGPSMFGIAGLDGLCCAAWLPTVALALFLRRGGARRGAQALAVLLLFGTFLPVLLGIAGRWSGRRMTETALEGASPDVVETLREVGYAESQHPFNLGLLSTVGLLLTAVLPLGLAMRAEKEPDE